MGLIIITMYSALTPWATGWRSSASGLLMIVCVACVLLLTNNESDTMTRESDSQTSTSTIKELVKVDQMAKAWTQCHLDEHQGYYSPAHGKPCCVKYFHAANNECAAAHKSRLASSCASLQSEESDTSACEERVVTQSKSSHRNTMLTSSSVTSPRHRKRGPPNSKNRSAAKTMCKRLFSRWKRRRRG